MFNQSFLHNMIIPLTVIQSKLRENCPNYYSFRNVNFHFYEANHISILFQLAERDTKGLYFLINSEYLVSFFSR